MSRRKSATPKERVLARHPRAYEAFISGGPDTRIYSGFPRYAILGKTWADAAKRLRGKR